MTAFDDAGWVARAQAFVDRIAKLPGVEVRSRAVDPPLGPGEVDRLAAAIGRPIPDALRQFLAHGSGRVDCGYAYAPAGARLEELRAVLPDYARSTAGWARETWVADDPGERALWEAGLPFAALANGDFLALDMRGGSPDPLVLYLNHDDASAALAPAFTEFLGRWEQLCYVGPEHWLLDPFLGPDGTLDARTPRADRLRALFGDPPP